MTQTSGIMYLPGLILCSSPVNASIFQSFRLRKKYAAKAALQPAMVLVARVPLDQDAIFIFTVGLVWRMEIFFLADERAGTAAVRRSL